MRVTAIAFFGILSAGLMSLYLPLWQLALGPILWGIPHIIGDLRYLVIKKKLYRSYLFWGLVATPLAYFTYQPRVTTSMIALGGAGIVAMAKRPLTSLHCLMSERIIRGMLVIGVAVVGYYLAKQHPYYAHFLLLHLHNIITIMIWWFWRPRHNKWEQLPIWLIMLFTLLLLCMWDADSWRQVHAHSSAPLSLVYFEATLARVLPIDWRPQWVVVYGFLQSLHYLVWIRLIPEDNRQAETPITFKRSALTLKQDFSGFFILITIIAMSALLVWSTFNLAAARISYLHWISAHASLEVAVIGYLFVERSKSITAR
jgi:hypothetical protein